MHESVHVCITGHAVGISVQEICKGVGGDAGISNLMVEKCI